MQPAATDSPAWSAASAVACPMGFEAEVISQTRGGRGGSGCGGGSDIRCGWMGLWVRDWLLGRL